MENKTGAMNLSFIDENGDVVSVDFVVPDILIALNKKKK